MWGKTCNRASGTLSSESTSQILYVLEGGVSYLSTQYAIRGGSVAMAYSAHRCYLTPLGALLPSSFFSSLPFKVTNCFSNFSAPLFYHFCDGMHVTDSALAGQPNEINDNVFLV